MPDDVPVINLDGRVALPGLIDAHSHVELSTLADHFWVVVRELDVATTLARMAEGVAEAAPGSWVVGQGTLARSCPRGRSSTRSLPTTPWWSARACISRWQTRSP